MALGFPTSPGNGDTFTLSGVTYTYNSTHGVWQIKPPPGTNLTNTPSATTVLLTSSTGTAHRFHPPLIRTWRWDAGRAHLYTRGARDARSCNDMV